MLTYVVLLENSWNYISMYCFSPIQVTLFQIMLKLNVARISECDLSYFKEIKPKKKYIYIYLYIYICIEKKKK